MLQAEVAMSPAKPTAQAPAPAASQTLDDERRYWNTRAATFPRYTPGDDQYEARVLHLAREAGVDFRGKSIVDVGCGSGLYTLRLAHEAGQGGGQVTALDLSDDMLDVLRTDAAAHGMANIDTQRTGWMEFRPDRAYDIVFTSMCPAIRDGASRRKLLDLAGEWLVFVGFVRREPSDILAGLYAHYGITPKDFHDAPLMRQWLDEQREPYTALPLTGQWVKRWQREDVLRHCRALLGGYGVSPDPTHLAAHVAAFQESPQPDAPYVEHSPYAVEVIVWRRV